MAGVSFSVRAGEIFGLLGPNGAGKTTLIKILLGVVRRSAGSAKVLGFPAGDRRARARIGYLPEHHRIPGHLTGATALEYFGQLSNMAMADIRRRRPEILDEVGLGRWAGTSVRQYSKGMLQRLGIAQAMLHRPALLILDEPTDGVDPVGRADIRRLLLRLKSEGHTIFLNSHLLQELELVCDRVAILRKGRLLHLGPLDDLLQGEGKTHRLRIQASDEQLAAVLPALPGAELRQGRPTDLPDDRHVEIDTPDQPALDAAIDRLRGVGISIRELRPARATLEEAFLRLLGDVDERP